MDSQEMADPRDTYFMGYHTPLRVSNDFVRALKGARKVTEAINKELHKAFPNAEVSSIQVELRK